MDNWPAYRSAYIIGLFMALPFSSWGQTERKTYTLQECIDVALKNNIDYKNADLDQQNARVTYQNNYGQKIPTLSLNGNQAINAGYTVDPFTNQFITQTIRSNNFSLNSSVTLFAGNQINNTHKRLKSAWATSEYVQQVTKNQIVLETAQFYVSLLSAYKILEAAQSRLTRVTSDKQRIERRIEAQAAAKSELADAEAQIASEDLNLSRAKGDITKQKLLLAQRMLLQDVNFEISIPQVDNLLKELPDTNVKVVFEKALANLPEIKASTQSIETARRAEQIARGGFMPTLSLNGSVTTGYSSARTRVVSTQTGGGTIENVYLNDTAGNLLSIPVSLFQNNSRSINSEKYPFGDQFRDNINRSVSVQASIPILNRLTTRNNLDNARITRLKAQNDLEKTKQTVFNNVALAITEYKISLANMAAYRRQVNSLETAFKTAEVRRDLGSGSSFDLLSPQLLLAAAQANLIQQKYDLIFRKLVIDFYTGKPINL